MESFEIANKYVNLIKNEFETSDLTLILYGSTVYGVSGSDLDMCFISEENFDRILFKKLIELTLAFHIDNKLRVDEDIAFEDKLLHSKSFIEEAISYLPFPVVNGRYIVPQIEKTKQFLKSEEMKKRLVLNILTVKRHVLFGNKKMVDDYSQKAWEEIIKVVASYCDLNNFGIDEFVNVLYKDPYNGNFGEMYLGYKDNLPEKREFLLAETETAFSNLVAQKKLVKTNKLYVPNREWLGDLKC